MKRSAWTSELRAPSPEAALDFILFEHLQHREMCNALDRLAEATQADAAAAGRLADYIRSDLAQHVADEEEVFFPMLRERCLPEDEIETALARMNQEHEQDRDFSVIVRQILLAMHEQDSPASAIPGAAESLRSFAQHQRRHMMLENAVLIPLARRRLSIEDIAMLGKRLAARNPDATMASS